MTHPNLSVESAAVEPIDVMERLLTAMPSFNSSPRMRSVPPEWIFVRDPSDKRLQFSAEAGPTDLGSRRPRPIPSPALPMLAQDRLGLHHVEMLSPTLRSEAAKLDPEDPIRNMKTGMRVGAHCDLELMTENQVSRARSPRDRTLATNVRSTRKSN